MLAAVAAAVFFVPAPAALAQTQPSSTASAPAAVQTTLVFTRKGKVFSDDVLLAVPPTAAPGFVLRLAPGAQPITCSSNVPSSVTQVGGVTDFQVMCTASSLPSVFAPTLEVYVKQ